MREDLRNAVRSLLQAPTFTGVALLVLALGIGASTAIFSVVDAVILKGLPFDEHDRLVAVVERDTLHPTTFGNGIATPQTYLYWREHQQAFEYLAAEGGARYEVRTETGEPASLAAEKVTWEFFPALRVWPMLGRAFASTDEGEQQHRVLILGYGLWQRQFGGAPDVVGRRLELDGDSWEIVGVMPRGFVYPVSSIGRFIEQPTELYVPMRFGKDDKIRGTSHNYHCNAIGRLRRGVSVQQAAAHMTQLNDALAKEDPKWRPGWTTEVMALHERLVGKVRPWMLMLLGVVGLVLAIACANVANLMLARSTVRSREIAIRAALGASRWRLLRALLVEGLVLSCTGAAIGVLLAYGGVQVLRLWLPHNVPRVAAIAIDQRVLGTALALALVTGIVFGCVPALHATRPDLVAGLKDGGRGATDGGASQRIRGVLVIAEVALAVVLLVGAGLFIRSFINLIQVDIGFDYRNVLTLNVSVPYRLGHPEEFAEIRKSGRGPLYVQQVLEAVRRVPGVEMVGGVQGGLPLTGSWSRTKIALPGRGELLGDGDDIDRRIVSADYLKLLRIPLLRGRYLNDRDTDKSPLVAVINQAAADRYWPGQDAVGRHFMLNKVDREIVGIVGNIHHLGPEFAPRQETYIPAAQDIWYGTTLAIRTAGDPMRVLPGVKAAIWSVNPNQILSEQTVTLEGYMDRFLAQRRFNMALLALFGLLGLVIAAAGLYGVMAYTVAQRTSEIGVRMALGATPANVVGMVLRQAARLTAAGLIIGIAGAWYLGASVRAFLFQVDATDIRVFALSLLVLAGAGLFASMVPARRAARVDPLIALRSE